MRSRVPAFAVAAVLAGCLVVMPVGPAPAARASPTGCPEPSTAAVTEFLDATVPQRIATDRVPGAVVSVVTAGATVAAKGYGSANVEDRVAFDPDRSMVRIASITKLFTWTAVMQQVEAGRLDLDADVNRYLDGFAVPAMYEQPVTLRTLLNHTAGFEERIVGTGAREAGDVVPLDRYLADNMPARIRPPGQVAAYSNYGAALAGHIVARVSGEPYDRYVQKHLLDPLGMAHSTAAEPVPAALAGGLARSYDTDVTPPRRIPFTFDQLTPDGSISATATDMAAFMRAHLDRGGPILTPQTAALMHTKSFAADPRLGGYAHGFMERYFGGRRVLMHDGSWEGFQSALVLVPGCGIGMFLSTNGTGGVETLGPVLDGFLARFAPPPATPDIPAAATWPVQTKPVAATAGFYQPTRHNETTLEKLTTLLGSMRLTVAGDGVVQFKGKDWKRQPDGSYARPDGSDRLVFLAGPDGQRYVATDGPTYALLNRGETLPFNLMVLLGFAVVALSALANLRRRPAGLSVRWRVSRALAAGAALLGLVALVALTADLLSNMSVFLYEVPLTFRLLLALPVLVVAAAAAALAGTVAGWRHSGAGVASRVHQVVLLAGLAAFTWFVWQWNLLGWQFT